MRLKAIFKKSIRSIWRNKGSYIACIAVLSVGLLVFISIISILFQIQSGVTRYYAETNFGDAFAVVSAMPKSELRELEDIEGVKAADGRLSQMVKANIGNAGEAVNVKLIGVDTTKEESVNAYTYEGNPLKYSNDIWVGKAFFEAHGLQIGDSVPLVINGRERGFSVQGHVRSSEFIAVISDTALLPDNRTYTVGFMRDEALENFISKQGIVTDISFLLEDGVAFDDIEKALDDKLSKYGLLSLVSRADQPSNSYITEEIDQMAVIGKVLPVVFLTVSFIMIFIMLKRLIEQERGEIGTFKAFGFRNAEIISGYILYGVIVALAAFAIAYALSGYMGTALYSVYREMYSLPDPSFIRSTDICLCALAISLAVGILSVLTGAYSILKVKPAEAMRAEAPKIKNSNTTFNSPFFKVIFNKTGIMALRSITRSKTRSLLIVFSVIAAFTLSNVIFAFKQSLEDTALVQPLRTEAYDIKFNLNGARPANDVISETKRISGVINAESMLVMPVQLIHENIKEDIAIYGVNQNSSLYKIRGMNGEYYEPPRNGILLNITVAEKLNVKKNSIIEIKSPYLQENEEVIVLDVFEEAIGPGCYMDGDVLSGLFYNKAMANTVLIKADKSKQSTVQEEIADFSNVSEIYNQEQVIETNKGFVQSILVMIYAVIIMAFIMGFGAIYNVSRISLAEKQRELATMRILGYRVDETASMNSFEQWIMLFVGIIAGFPPALLFKDFLADAFSSDLFTLRINLSVTSTTVAVLCCVAAVLLSNISAKREIKRYSLAEVLKERE